MWPGCAEVRRTVPRSGRTVVTRVAAGAGAASARAGRASVAGPHPAVARAARPAAAREAIAPEWGIRTVRSPRHSGPDLGACGITDESLDRPGPRDRRRGPN